MHFLSSSSSSSLSLSSTVSAIHTIILSWLILIYIATWTSDGTTGIATGNGGDWNGVVVAAASAPSLSSSSSLTSSTSFTSTSEQLLDDNDQIETQTTNNGNDNINNNNNDIRDENDDDLKHHQQPLTVIIIDVDNCLYSEQEIKQRHRSDHTYSNHLHDNHDKETRDANENNLESIHIQMGIEQQIVQNTHRFANQYFNLTPQQSDELYRSYGSTIEGLVAMLRSNQLHIQKDHDDPHTNNDNDDPNEQLLERIQSQFYKEVYEPIDMTPLLPPPPSSYSSTLNTGYNHETTQKQRLALLQTLKTISTNKQHYRLYLASNSPKTHVLRVLSALGLLDVPLDGILTPDHPPQRNYPTKHSPQSYYQPILSRYPSHRNRVVLLDDSRYNLKVAKQVGIDGLHIRHDGDQRDDRHPKSYSLEEALSFVLGHDVTDVDGADGSAREDGDNDYAFSDVQYLQSKNEVDAVSIHGGVWKQLAEELSHRIIGSSAIGSESQGELVTSLTIVDVGAGLLSMLKMILFGGGSGGGDDEEPNGTKKESLLSLIQNELNAVKDEDEMKRNNTPLTLREVRYVAYEPNANLISKCIDNLHTMGFVQVKVNDDDDDDDTLKHSNTDDNHREKSFLFRQTLNQGEGLPTVDVKVWLRVKDFSEETYTSVSVDGNRAPDLIVGCCFADLFDPQELAISLLRYTNHLAPVDSSTNDHSRSSMLLYFPITFTGTTQFHPPLPYDVSNSPATLSTSDSSSKMVIPSDTRAFQLYADSLIEQHGHNLDPDLIVSALKDHGGELLSRGPSDWEIHPRRHGYLWNTMMHFFGKSAAPEIMKHGWDSRGWMNRAMAKRDSVQSSSTKSKREIRVSNTDLLFSLPLVTSANENWNLDGALSERRGTGEQDDDKVVVDEILFEAPYKVGKVTKEWNYGTAEGQIPHLKSGQVEIRSICSLISSGTELKIFKGMFGEDAALDTSIKGMEDEVMKYPLSYGYSLVGVVTRSAPDVPDAEDIIGKLVFAFSPHASRIVVDRNSVHIVPNGIDPEDAIFMPSVETALSIVHDAHVRIGGKVAIFGQGLIGLLVNAILSRHQIASRGGTGQFGTVTVFDMLSSRLAMASVMGAHQALLPSDAKTAGPFDVCIEVSGNARALQSAIDNTFSGGRIIIGSWYGNSDVALKLGIDFHRSHKTIKTSQVSFIPAELTALWSKERRFALTWELVQLLRPRRLITKKLTLDDAQEAYELLDKGKEIAVVFSYD